MGLAAEKAGKNLAVNSGILWNLKKELVRGILAIPGPESTGLTGREGAPISSMFILKEWTGGPGHMLEEREFTFHRFRLSFAPG